MGLPRTTGNGGQPPQRLSHTHEQILNWMVLNPELSMRHCADHFGYTQSWLSTLVRSDLFQAALRERQIMVASRVAASIPAKLAAVADVALDKLGEMVEKSEDPEFILDAADKALHRMGYAPQSSRNPAGSPSTFGPGAVVQQNNVFIGQADLAEARALMQSSAAVLSPLAAPAPDGFRRAPDEKVISDVDPLP